MGYAVNMQWAKDAIEHVRKAMALGASNQLGDTLGSMGMSLLCVAAQRSVEVPVTARKGVPVVDRRGGGEGRTCGLR